jgi:hypothetical protein
MGPDGDPDSGEEPEVGSLAEEAAKLLGALKGWAHDHGAGVGHGITDAAGRAGDAVHDVDEHLATGAPECTVCPVCRAVHAVRGLSPEVRSHLSSAATSFGQAVGAFLSTQPPGPPSPPGDVTAPHRDEA